jgi:UDP-2,3-diacylglucosamine hydrolase
MIYFVSDVHLGFGPPDADRARERALSATLHAIAADATRVFIVGDLFDYWFDYASVIPRDFVRTLATLHDLRDAGVEITYLMGNHDFGHYSYFRDVLGIDVLEHDLDIMLGSKRFIIAHGDGKAHNDMGYRILRSILRNKVIQALYRMLHPTIGIGLASRTSRGSRAYTDKKDYGTVDGLRDFAVHKISEGADFVVMGHRHRVIQEQIGSGQYINLGDWLGTHGRIGVYDPDTGQFGVRDVNIY